MRCGLKHEQHGLRDYFTQITALPFFLINGHGFPREFFFKLDRTKSLGGETVCRLAKLSGPPVVTQSFGHFVLHLEMQSTRGVRVMKIGIDIDGSLEEAVRLLKPSVVIQRVAHRD